MKKRILSYQGPADRGLDRCFAGARRQIPRHPAWQLLVGDGHGTQRGGQGQHFRSMAHNEIKALPVQNSLATTDFYFYGCQRPCSYLASTCCKRGGSPTAHTPTGGRIRLEPAIIFACGARICCWASDPAQRRFTRNQIRIVTPRGRHSEKPRIYDLIEQAVAPGLASNCLPEWCHTAVGITVAIKLKAIAHRRTHPRLGATQVGSNPVRRSGIECRS